MLCIFFKVVHHISDEKISVANAIVVFFGGRLCVRL